MKKSALISFLCLYATTSIAANFDQSLQTEWLYTENDHVGYVKEFGYLHPGYIDTNDLYANLVDYPSESEGFLNLAKSDNNKANTTAPLFQTYPLYLTIQDEKDWQYLKEQTYTILGSCFVLLGVMTLLPESTTGWDRESRELDNLWNKWQDNIADGPTWDSDDDYLNYVMHPYFGGVYYTASRHAGFDRYESLLYSFAMSTFFWEYGVEAFTERPSSQDLIITPLFGALAGEAMLNQEQAILANGGRVWGSEILGDISLFFLNPVGHIHHWVTASWWEDSELNLIYSPEMVQLNLKLRF